jgi:hypothetical protein
VTLAEQLPRLGWADVARHDVESLRREAQKEFAAQNERWDSKLEALEDRLTVKIEQRFVDFLRLTIFTQIATLLSVGAIMVTAVVMVRP